MKNGIFAMRDATMTLSAMVLLAFSLLITVPAQAESVDMPIGVNLVKCGDTRADLPKACRKDERCCVFVDDYAANGERPQSIPAYEPFNDPRSKTYQIAMGTALQ